MRRVRFVLLTAAFAIFAVAASAQSASAQQSTSGGGTGIVAKGGAIFTSIKDAGDGYDVHTGMEFGVALGGNRTGVLGFSIEALYAKQAQKAKGQKQVDLHYLEVPLLARLNLGTKSKNGFTIYAIGGPVADVLLKGSQDGFDVKSNYESLDLGVLVGGGVEMSRFVVEGRYNIGLKNIRKGSSTDIKKRSFAVLVGIRLN